MDINPSCQPAPAPMVVDSPSPPDEPQDYYTADEHTRMDKEVKAKLEQKRAIWRENPSIPELCGVLRAIAQSDPLLHRQYLDSDIVFPDHVETKLSAAWRAMSFQSVRILPCLQAPKDSLTQEEFTAFEEAMAHDYRGGAADAFIQYLKRNDRAFHSHSRPYYAKFCAITQSSGAGKTRLLFELGKKDIFILYMNLRPLEDGGYPLRDTIPADILSEYCVTEREYFSKCQIFFATILKCLASFLHREPNPVGVLSSVNDRRRTEFLEDIKKEFANVEQETLSSSSSKVLDQYVKKLLSSGRLQQAKDFPEVIIALDEDRELHEQWENRGYLRTTVLRQVIKRSFRHAPVWVVFASSQVWQIAPHISQPQTLLPSARSPLEGNLLFPPFTQLGWDQHTPVLEEVELDNVGWGRHILQYGRPIWWSLKGRYTLTQILELARRKLCASETFNPKLHFHAFAVLGQRFGLDIPFGRYHALRDSENLVANHLRILIKETEDRIWSYTTYPSEPILSAVAADCLHKDKNLSDSLATLLDMAKEGLINTDDTGELASRILWLLARDFCIHEDHEPPSKSPSTGDVVKNDFEIPYCRPVPVIEFLKLAFGPHILDNAPDARKVFEDAYINFSHWVQMKFDITRGDGGRNDVSIEEWTETLWARTSAIQCCRNQPLIDKVIPMYFKSRPRETAMSHILISNKARDSAEPVILDEITRNHENIAPCYRGPPYIAILADLGLSSEDSCDVVVHDKSTTDDPCLRIYAPGLNKKTYPFLPDDIAGTLNELYEQSMPSRPTMFQELEAEVQFGWSREARYMK